MKGYYNFFDCASYTFNAAIQRLIPENVRSIAVVEEAVAGIDPGTGYLVSEIKSGGTMTPQGTFQTPDTLADEFGADAGQLTQLNQAVSYTLNLRGNALGDNLEFAPYLKASAVSRETGIYFEIDTTTGATFTPGESLITVTGGTAIGQLLHVAGRLQTGTLGATPDVPRVTASTTALNMHVRYTAALSAGDMIVGRHVTNTAGTVSGIIAGNTGVTSYIFTPASDLATQSSITVHDTFGTDQTRKANGVRGNTVFNFGLDALPTLAFTHQGSYNTPAVSSPVAATSQTTVGKIWKCTETRINGLPFTTVSFKSWDLDLGNTLSPNPDANNCNQLRGFIVTQAMPTLNIGVTNPGIANYNPFSVWEDGTIFSAYTLHNSNGAKGERFLQGTNNAQYSTVADTVFDGVAGFTLTANCIRSTIVGMPKWFLINW
jgi:hypothetical protein